MAQSITKQFQAALNYLLAEEGRGAQSRLASEQNIDRGYLNAIIKGRKPGAEDVRLSIAAHFSMIFEDMLALGRRILERKNKVIEQEKAGSRYGKKTFTTTGGGQIEADGDVLNKSTESVDGLTSNSQTIFKALEILESDTSYGSNLKGSIELFHEIISTKNENQALRSQMLAMDSRIAKLEKMLSGKKRTLPKLEKKRN